MKLAIVFKKLFLVTAFSLYAVANYAQDGKPSPELAQMVNNAEQYMKRGNLKDAITAYRQALLLSPNKTELQAGLGQALFLDGNYEEAEKVLEHVSEQKGADEKVYRLLAASEERQHKEKKAKRTLQAGLVHFPSSGLLYNELGKEYAEEQKMVNALNAWIDGIERAPRYADNYNSAAELYFARGRQLWGILYAEQYLYLTADTLRNDTIKRQLYAGYKDFLGWMAIEAISAGIHDKTVATFEDAVQDIYMSLTTVMGTEITTENLAMLRVRFLMEWFAKYNKQLPFPLFNYQDELLRSGHFDMNTEWLFGKAESELQYDAWNKFHDGDMDRYIKWQEAHSFQPKATRDYNSRKMEGISEK